MSPHYPNAHSFSQSYKFRVVGERELICNVLQWLATQATGVVHIDDCYLLADDDGGAHIEVEFFSVRDATLFKTWHV